MSLPSGMSRIRSAKLSLTMDKFGSVEGEKKKRSTPCRSPGQPGLSGLATTALVQSFFYASDLLNLGDVDVAGVGARGIARPVGRQDTGSMGLSAAGFRVQ